MRQPCAKCIYLSRSYCDRHYIRREDGDVQKEFEEEGVKFLCDFVRLVDKPLKQKAEESNE